MRLRLRRWLRNEHGQDLIEYLLLGSFVSIVALAGAQTMGSQLNSWYSAMGSWVESAAATIPTGEEPAEPAE